MSRNRYVLLTVDVEAQPARAREEHVKRLVWGEHANGRASIKEMCTIADDVGGRLVHFVDACGVYLHGEPFAEAVRWMVWAGHDVQLHSHSEFLSDSFWAEHGFAARPRLLNQYDEAKAAFTLRYFSEYLAALLAKKFGPFGRARSVGIGGH